MFCDKIAGRDKSQFWVHRDPVVGHLRAGHGCAGLLRRLGCHLHISCICSQAHPRGAENSCCPTLYNFKDAQGVTPAYKGLRGGPA